MTDLGTLLDSDSTTREQIWAAIEAVPAGQRASLLTQLNGRRQRRLYALSEGGPAFTPEDFLPEGGATHQPRPHQGRNSLPAFSSFQKVMYRSSDGSRIYGRNLSSVSWLVGHGYFEVVPDDSGKAPVVFRYTSIPGSSDKPGDWPEIKPNERGVSRLVYGYMDDYVRLAGPGFYIGEAWVKGKNTGNYFVLVA